MSRLKSILTSYEKYLSAWNTYIEHNFIYLKIYENLMYYKIENLSLFEFYRESSVKIITIICENVWKFN